MVSGRRIAVANALMALGVLPMLAWFVLLVRSVLRVETGEFDLSDLMFVGVAGMGAYLVTLVVAGAGAIWAGLMVRASSGGSRRAARFLVALTSAVLLLPLGGVIALIAARYFD